MNTSLVNCVGKHHLPVHVSARPPVVPPTPVLGCCVPRGSLTGRMCLEDVSIKMPAVHQPLNTHFQSASQASDFLPSHSGSCCPMSLFIHCLLLKVYTPETKRKKKNEPKAGPGTRREGI